MSEVDIIMPNYNKSKFVGEAVDSVLSQTFEDWQLYIIDDFSTDESISILEKYESDKRINFIKLKRNKGPSFCRNFGIRISKSRLIAFIDSDDYWTKIN